MADEMFVVRLEIGVRTDTKANAVETVRAIMDYAVGNSEVGEAYGEFVEWAFRHWPETGDHRA